MINHFLACDFSIFSMDNLEKNLHLEPPLLEWVTLMPDRFSLIFAILTFFSPKVLHKCIMVNWPSLELLRLPIRISCVLGHWYIVCFIDLIHVFQMENVGTQLGSIESFGITMHIEIWDIQNSPIFWSNLLDFKSSMHKMIPVKPIIIA